MTGLIYSRKFWLAILALVVVIVNHAWEIELTTAELAAVVLPILAAIFGTAWEDAAEKGRVFTDAELKPTPLLEGTICDGCLSCVRECEACAIGDSRDVKLTIEGREFAHAPFDAAACGPVHRGDDPRFSPFWSGSEADGEKPAYYSFLDHRFRHRGICVGRGCLRACLDHLEKTHRIQATFKTPLIRRERWKLDEPPK